MNPMATLRQAAWLNGGSAAKPTTLQAADSTEVWPVRVTASAASYSGAAPPRICTSAKAEVAHGAADGVEQGEVHRTAGVVAEVADGIAVALEDGRVAAADGRPAGVGAGVVGVVVGVEVKAVCQFVADAVVGVGVRPRAADGVAAVEEDAGVGLALAEEGLPSPSRSQRTAFGAPKLRLPLSTSLPWSASTGHVTRAAGAR